MATTDPMPLRDAVAEAAGSVGLIITKWVVVAEVFTADGNKELLMCSPDDVADWDAIGMLQFATNAWGDDD